MFWGKISIFTVLEVKQKNNQRKKKINNNFICNFYTWAQESWKFGEKTMTKFDVTVAVKHVSVI